MSEVLGFPSESVVEAEQYKADAERWRKLVRLLEKDDSIKFSEFHGWSIEKYYHDPVTLGSGSTLNDAIDNIKE